MLTSSLPTAIRAVTELRRANKTSADYCLLALASKLEDAARPFLAYDRDATVTSADPDFEEALETGRRLYGTVKAVADRIFTHQPESLAGLLVQAHAATLVAEHSWDDTSEQVGQDGTLLRLLANGLFRLAGVDWRGRPLEGKAAIQADTAPAEAADDAVFLALAPVVLPMLECFDKLWSAAEAKYEIAEAEAQSLGLDLGSPQTKDLPSWCDYVAMRVPIDALDNALEEMIAAHMDRPVSTLEALLLKQRISRTLHQYKHDAANDLDELLSARLASGRPLVGGDHTSRPSLATPTDSDAALIPLAEAAIAEERTASAMSEAADHDLPPGTFAKSMQLLELVTSTDARTPAGVAAKARVFLAHAAETDDLDGDWRCQALALSIARDAARLGAAG